MWTLIKHTEPKGILESKFYDELEKLSVKTIATISSEFVANLERMLKDDVSWVQAIYAGDVFKAHIINPSCVEIWRYTTKGQKSYKMASLTFAIWEIELVDRYYYASGRNHDTYKEVTFWFNPLSMERRETTREESVGTDEQWKLPDWAKSITTRRKSLEHNFY